MTDNLNQGGLRKRLTQASSYFYAVFNRGLSKEVEGLSWRLLETRGVEWRRMSSTSSLKADKLQALKKKLNVSKNQKRDGNSAFVVAVVLFLIVCLSSVWYLYSPPTAVELNYPDEDFMDNYAFDDITIEQRLKLKRKEEAAAKRKRPGGKEKEEGKNEEK